MPLVLDPRIKADLGPPCVFCGRPVMDPETRYRSRVGAPDKAWCIRKVTELGKHLDDDVSFGPTGKVKLCLSCRDGAFLEIDAETVIDERDGLPKVLKFKGI